ncbi:unnamed protein product, partial [Staurois parvus]
MTRDCGQHRDDQTADSTGLTRDCGGHTNDRQVPAMDHLPRS